MLVGGRRVSKGSLRVEAYGEIDELNSLLGIARAEISDASIDATLERLQNELFTVGADLASPLDVDAPRVKDEWVSQLERTIDECNQELPPLEEFILPGGSRGGAILHLARAVARRAERRIVQLSHQEAINPALLPYVNRLSDLLFVLARITNARQGKPEKLATFSKRKT